MTALVNRLIEQINVKCLGVPLIEAGFRRKGRVWTRTRDDRTDLVEMVLGKWNEGGSGRFTVELGVAYPGLLEEVAEIEGFQYYRPYLGKLAIEACQIRERIGFLLDSPSDRWWEVRSEGPIEPVGNEVAGFVATRGFAWFEQQPSEAAFGRFPGATGLFQVVALIRHGDLERGRQALASYLAEPRVVAAGQAGLVAAWAAARGV